MGFKSIFSVLLCLGSMALQAQIYEFNLPETDDLPEATFGESQYAELLNAADSLDLAGIGILPDSIRQLLQYRREYGPLLSPYELQQLPAWDESLTAYCLQQLLLKDGEEGFKRSPSHSFPRQLNARLAAGSRDLRSSIRFKPALPPEARPLQMRLRFRLQYQQQMSFGLALEKDAGEPWTYPQQPLPDYRSLHFFLRPEGRILRAMAAGDYELRLGQGLLIRQGFGLFKSTAPESMVAGGPRLKPHSGMDETRFLRGLAFEARLPRQPDFHLLVFASRKAVDARIDSVSQTVSSLPETGSHPLSSVPWRKALPETLFGASLRWQAAPSRQWTLNAMRLSYPLPLQAPGEEVPYRLYAMDGKQQFRISLDHKMQFKQVLLFGEFALCDGRYPALVQGLLAPFGKFLDLGILYRYYHPGYGDRYADAFSEGSSPRNEQGLYLSLRYRLTRRWTLEAYGDLWKKPWLSYNYPSPRRGYDTRILLQWKRRKLAQVYLQVRFQSREQFKAGAPGFEQSQSWRFHLVYKLTPSLEWRCRLEEKRVGEVSKRTLSLSKGTFGNLFYQELVFARLGSPLRWNIRWTHYRTDSYDARIYAYERGLLDQHAISAFYGSGQRLRLNTRYKISKQWTAELGLSWDFQSQKISAEGMEIMAQIVWRMEK